MKKSEKAVLGIWRITGKEVWDADYFDILVRAEFSWLGVDEDDPCERTRLARGGGRSGAGAHVHPSR